MGNVCNSKSAPKADANKPPTIENNQPAEEVKAAPVVAVVAETKVELPLSDLMTYIRTGNLQMVNKTIESYAPRSVNFVRGIDEDFEAADPTIPMEEFSLVEVALAYKQNEIVNKLSTTYKYPVLNMRYSEASDKSATSTLTEE
jgi:hypothetical protein